jgi:hypothetical protein
MHEVMPGEVASSIAERIQSKSTALGRILDDVLRGFDNRSKIRRPIEHSEFADELVAGRASPDYTRDQRARRLALLSERSRSREDAVAAAVGMELWTLGIQMILTLKTDSQPTSS